MLVLIIVVQYIISACRIKMPNHSMVLKVLLKSFIHCQRNCRLFMVLQSIVLRRSLLLQWCLASLSLLFNSNETSVRQCSCCRRGQNKGLWNLVWSNYSDKGFITTFHIRRTTFNFILTHTRQAQVRETVNEVPVSPEY